MENGLIKAARVILHGVAATYGGYYIPGTGDTGARVQGNGWSLSFGLAKFSNGEALLAQARHGAAVATDLDPHAALAAVGVKRKDQT